MLKKMQQVFPVILIMSSKESKTAYLPVET